MELVRNQPILNALNVKKKGTIPISVQIQNEICVLFVNRRSILPVRVHSVEKKLVQDQMLRRRRRHRKKDVLSFT